MLYPTELSDHRNGFRALGKISRGGWFSSVGGGVTGCRVGAGERAAFFGMCLALPGLLDFLPGVVQGMAWAGSFLGEPGIPAFFLLSRVILHDRRYEIWTLSSLR